MNDARLAIVVCICGIALSACDRNATQSKDERPPVTAESTSKTASGKAPLASPAADEEKAAAAPSSVPPPARSADSAEEPAKAAPPVEPASVPKRTSRSTPGTLTIAFSWAGFPGPWLYVDGKLIRAFRDQNLSFDVVTHSVSLEPGRHKVQIVFCKNGHLVTTESAVVQIEPGGSIRFERPVLGGDSNPHPLDFKQVYAAGVVGLGEPHVHGAFKDIGYAEWLAGWATWIGGQSQLVDSDPLTKALRRMHADFKRRPPARNVALLDLPEKLGGPREVDGTQVRILLRDLTQEYWGRWPETVALPMAEPDEKLRLALTQYERLQAIVKQKLEEMNELKGVARMMEEAGD